MPTSPSAPPITLHRGCVGWPRAWVLEGSSQCPLNAVGAQVWFLAIAFLGVPQVGFPDHLYRIVWAHLNLNGMKPQNLHFLTSSWATPCVQNSSPKVKEIREAPGKSVRSGVSVKRTSPSVRDPPSH